MKNSPDKKERTLIHCRIPIPALGPHALEMPAGWINNESLVKENPVVAERLDLLKGLYEETENTVFAIKAFNMCLKNWLFPDLWILAVLKSPFEEYESAEGKASLDKLLKLKKQGQESPFKAARRYVQRDSRLLFVLKMITDFFDISLKDACYMTSTYFEDNPITDRDGTHYEVPNEDTLERLFYTKWGPMGGLKGTREEPQGNSEAIRLLSDAFLGRFSERAIPKAYLGRYRNAKQTAFPEVVEEEVDKLFAPFREFLDL